MSGRSSQSTRYTSNAMLAGLFDLPPAEARVARAVGMGQTAEAIAASLSLSPETIRTQIKAILAKAGVKRQIELAFLLASARLPVAGTDAGPDRRKPGVPPSARSHPIRFL